MNSEGILAAGVNLTSHLHQTSRLKIHAIMIALHRSSLWIANGNCTLSVSAVYLTTRKVIPNHWIIMYNELQIVWRDEIRPHLTYYSGIFLEDPSGRAV
jgi:hypothetical protein